MAPSTLNIYESLAWSLQKLWKDYHSNLNSCRQKPKTGPIHDLRISLRKILAILDFTIEIHPAKSVKNLRKDLKSELKLLTDLRDLQNHEKTLNEKLKPKELKEFRDILSKKRKIEQKKVKPRLNNIDIKKQSRVIQKLNEELLTLAENSKTESMPIKTLNRIESQLFKNFETATIRAKKDDPFTIHRSRIAFKKLRYSWESLESVFPTSNKLADRLKNHQKLLGKIQDSKVLIEYLLGYLVDQQITHPTSDFLKFLRSVEKEQETWIEQFISQRKTLLKELRPPQASPHASGQIKAA